MVTDVVISPSTATATDSLTCSYQFSDADNDKDKSTIHWTINGVEVKQPEPLQSFDQVTCTCTRRWFRTRNAGLCDHQYRQLAARIDGVTLEQKTYQ